MLTAIVAPTTVLTALLFHIGWIRTNALFQYFGVDATALGFTTQDYLLRSTEALYVPLGTLLVVGPRGRVDAWPGGGVARRAPPGRGVAAHRRRRRRRRSRGAGAVCPRRGRGRRAAAVPQRLPGLAGVPGARRDPGRLRPVAVAAPAAAPGSPGRREPAALARPGRAGPGRHAGGAQPVLAATDYARAYGRGRAVAYARDLAVRPGVVAYSAERLFLQGPGVREAALPAGQHASYRYPTAGCGC